MTDRPDEPPPPHRRRTRYAGTHPKRFDERYKELASERYPGIVEHVRAKGRTPAGQHVPILVEEILAVLAPMPGERGVDATLGFGGHARRLLERAR
jgi:16S rRNA (cytosine1402-N4)-methyltransferase